jgi:hypothetical protein
MEIIRQIGLQSIEILTLITGILGITLSAMLLLTPNLTKSLSKILNHRINFDDKIGILDKDFEIAHHFYNHHVVIGMFLIGGGAFALFFFSFSLDATRFISVFLGSQKGTFLTGILIDSIIWIGKVVCLIALSCGLLLVFTPAKMKQIETKLNSWFETKSLVEKLDKTNHDLDSFIFRHPIMMGVAGTFLSFFLLSLSVINLLD